MKHILFKTLLLTLLMFIVSGLGAQIANLPYDQDFDEVVTPDLPLGWQSVIPGGDANIRTDNINPHSNPNCVRIYSGSAANGNMLLITPEVQDPVAINSLRLRFWLRASNYTSNLSIGVLSNPNVAASFEQVYALQPGTAWQEHILNFSAYAGAGRYLAIKYTPTGGNTYFFLDDLHIESIPQNDLAVLSITGNPTPGIGHPVTYQIGLKNYGLNAQTNYQVKLYGLGEIQLGTVNGSSIGSGESKTILLPWTPNTLGYNTIHATVQLTGDEFAYNNQSQVMNIAVISDIPIPPITPTQLARIPMDFFYKNSICQYILYPGDFSFPPVSGNIAALEVVSNLSTSISNTPTKIWLGTTVQNDLSGGWIQTSSLTLVYDALHSYPSGGYNNRFELSMPYPYNGQNLVVMFQRPWDPVYYSSFDQFNCWTASESRNRRVFSDTMNYDPYALPASSTLSTIIPVTRVYIYPVVTGNLSGLVMDSEGAPVANATVQLGINNTVSAADGSYSFTGTDLGESVLSFNKAGFYPYTQVVNIGVSQPVEIETVLYRQMGFLEGLVRNENGIPIQGATAHLNSYVTTTNEMGIFHFAVPVGSYFLLVSMEGMTSQSFMGVQILAEQYQDYNITLHPGTATDDPETPPLSNMLLNCYPNPFGNQTTMQYQLKQAGQVSLEIYNLKGQLVRTLLSINKSPGTYEIIWGGRNNKGEIAGSGVYFCKMTAGDYTTTKKLLKISDR
jgi:hypothetical protein